MDDKIMERVMEITDKGLREKLEREVLDARRQAEKDREVVERAVRLIQANLMYKDECFGGRHHYVLATEEMFFQDFMKKPEYEWKRGIKFVDSDEEKKRVYLSGAFRVNGEAYYDMRYLLDKYTRDVENEMQEICSYTDRLRDIKQKFDDLVSQAPAIKRLIEQWTAAHEETEHDSD